jgi:uncharacterized membrane-anchored protein YjiN (DUF445 family)
MPLLVQDELSAARLRRMKVTATALLGVAAVLYVVSLSFDGTAIGFLRAGSEAAMVGGLADWFAVTALFRQPLGLPIPHTGLVPRKKDELATKLGEFVTGHFLTREVVVEQLREADVVTRVGRFLGDPEVAERLAREVAFNAGVLLEALDDESVVQAALELLRRDQARRSYAPVLGQVLERAIAGGTQRPLVDVLVSRSLSYLRAHRDELVPQLRTFVEERSWLAALFVTDKRVRHLLDGVADTLQEIDRDPQHPMRGWLDGLLRSFADELQHDRHTAAQLDRLLGQLLEDPQAQAVLREVLTDAIVSVRESLADVDGSLQHRIAALISSLAARAVHDQVFRARVQAVLEALTGHAVENYGDELTALIRTQVARWDATSASRRIELAVGRDLQFIRINGTAVGALAGLTIHAVTLALP